jgi:hypothetical protein
LFGESGENSMDIFIMILLSLDTVIRTALITTACGSVTIKVPFYIFK